MGKYVALRDRRLMGGVPARPRLSIINTDGSTALSQAFNSVRAVAHTGRVDSLFILCHGYAGENTRGQVSADAGGMGLQLGREGVMHKNVTMWSALKNRVTNIVVYACAAADTQPGNEGSTADGRYLMGALAIQTGAHVFAADRIQWYSTYNGANNGRYDFGAWEGQLLYFPPTGAQAIPVAGAPVELADVMSGSAP